MKDWWDQVLPFRNVCMVCMKKFNPESHLHFKIFLYNIQKAVDLSKDDLLGDILQDLNTEVSEFPGVIRCRGIDWRNSSVIIQNKLSLERNVPGYYHTCTYKIPPHTNKKTRAPKLVSSHCFRFLLTILGEEFPTVTALDDYVDGLCGCVLEVVRIHPVVGSVNVHCLYFVAIVYVP